MSFFFASGQKLLESFVFAFSKSFGKRTLSHPSQSVIILVNEQIGHPAMQLSDFV